MNEYQIKDMTDASFDIRNPMIDTA